MHGTCVPLLFAYTRMRNVAGLRSSAGAFLPNYIDGLSLQQRKRIQRMTLIFCVWNLQPFTASIALGSIGTGSPEWLYQTTSNSSLISLKHTSSQRSVTNSHAWAQDLELKEDSKNDVLNCLNLVLLSLQNSLVVRSHMKHHQLVSFASFEKKNIA